MVFKGVRLESVLPSRPADGGRAPYVLSLGALALALGLALHAVYSFFFVSLRRLRYPYELEWMEGGMLGHALQILAGKPLYPEPSPDFVPFIYGPLYSYAGALSAGIFGPSLFSLRLVSFVSTLAVLVFLHRIVAYETSSWRFGAIAPCLYLATFGASGGWFDLARIDSFSLAWLFGAIDAVRRAERPRQLVIAGALLACAVLTKQTCAVVFPRSPGTRSRRLDGGGSSRSPAAVPRSESCGRGSSSCVREAGFSTTPSSSRCFTERRIENT